MGEKIMVFYGSLFLAPKRAPKIIFLDFMVFLTSRIKVCELMIPKDHNLV